MTFQLENVQTNEYPHFDAYGRKIPFGSPNKVTCICKLYHCVIKPKIIMIMMTMMNLFSFLHVCKDTYRVYLYGIFP